MLCGDLNGKEIQKKREGTSLVAQWFRICLPMQGTRVRSLVREDPTFHGASKPVCHNYWAHVPQLLKPARLEPMLRNEKPWQWEARASHPRVAPLAATRESLRAATKTQRSQKKKGTISCMVKTYTHIKKVHSAVKFGRLSPPHLLCQPVSPLELKLLEPGLHMFSLYPSSWVLSSRFLLENRWLFFSVNY